MKYEFKLLKGYSLPIFKNKIGTKGKLDANICIDSGCGITTFYKSESIVGAMFPNIRPANSTVEVRNASGTKDKLPLYIIPELVLIDENNNLLHIMNLYCCIVPVNMPQIDVLLAGAIFFSSRMIIELARKEETKEPYRTFKVNTLIKGRDTLYMERQEGNDRVHYICALNAPQK